MKPTGADIRPSWTVPHDLAAPVAGAGAGRLAGLRAAVKDAFDIAGARTGAGSPEWLAEQGPAPAHAEVVARVLAAGATVTTKTVCDELFYSLSGVSAHYGTPVNSQAPGRIPGGSSSGSAAATAAGACDFALGTDTGGSVRVPAAFCGVYGIRPTHGRVPLDGCVPMAPSFDVAGWFARDPGVLGDVGAVLLAGGEAVSKPVGRVVVAEDALAEADADIVAAVGALHRRAGDLLPAGDRLRLGVDGLDAWRESFRTIQAFEIWQNFGEFVTRARPALGPGVRERVAFAAEVGEPAHAAALATAEQARRRLRALLTPGTVALLPTAPCVAPSIDAGPAELESFRTRCMRLTCIAGLAGLPQVSIPCASASGYPAGVSLVGWAGGDEVLLGLATALSRLRGSR